MSSFTVNNLQLPQKLSCFEKLHHALFNKDKCHRKYEIIQVFLEIPIYTVLIINFVKRQSFCVLYFVIELQCHMSHGFANHNKLSLSFAESCLEWRKSEACLEEGWLLLTLPRMAHHQLRTMKAAKNKIIKGTVTMDKLNDGTCLSLVSRDMTKMLHNLHQCQLSQPNLSVSHTGHQISQIWREVLKYNFHTYFGRFFGGFGGISVIYLTCLWLNQQNTFFGGQEKVK